MRAVLYMDFKQKIEKLKLRKRNNSSRKRLHAYFPLIKRKEGFDMANLGEIDVEEEGFLREGLQRLMVSIILEYPSNIPISSSQQPINFQFQQTQLGVNTCISYIYHP